MLIGISGPQGGGKSTLLTALRDQGFIVDDYKVSRDVQHRLKVDSLDDLTKHPATMMDFQEAIFEAKYNREHENCTKGNKILLSERTFADISSYAQLWAYELVHQGQWGLREAMDWALQFTKRCASAQNIYDGVIHLPRMEHVAFVQDARRASKETIEFIAEQLDRFYEVHQKPNIKLHRVTGLTVQERADESAAFLKGLIHVN